MRMMPLGQLKKGILNLKRCPMIFEALEVGHCQQEMFGCDKEHD
jgi:hypothetical protein